MSRFEVNPAVHRQVFKTPEWPELADPGLSHCNIVAQCSDPAQKAANGKNPKQPVATCSSNVRSVTNIPDLSNTPLLKFLRFDFQVSAAYMGSEPHLETHPCFIGANGIDYLGLHLKVSQLLCIELLDRVS